MIEEVKTAYRFLVILGIGALLLLLSLAVPVLSSNADFSIYNSGWSGCSDLGREAYSTGSLLPTIDVSSSSEEMIVHSSFSDLRSEIDPDDSALMIIGPATDFDGDELDFLHVFINNGGILFLADDIGTGYQVLDHLNTSTRISRKIMVDLSFMKQPEFAVTTNISDSPLTRGVERIMMNYASTVYPSKEAVSVVNSSHTAWLDSTRNDIRDPDERPGPFSIMTTEEYGQGRIIVLSDPSILINQMRNRFDNGLLISNLVSYLTEGRGTLIIDESHRDTANPVQFTNMFISDLDITGKVGILAGLTGVFLFISNPYPRRALNYLERLLNKLLSGESGSKRTTKEELISSVMKKHPDWDRDILERLMKEIGDAG